MKYSYLIGNIDSVSGNIPQVSRELGFRDYLGTIMVRWGINRDNYKVTPGLYAVGSPDSSSDVFVTANYKLSFDTLRKNLKGMNGWILVLNTRGINVWCAAGKGTFGTNELINRISSVTLDKIVSHKRIILPQLGATGVAAHKVKEETGFNVHYGPVRAADIKNFVDDGYRASREMRKVTFNFADRIKLIPNDFMYGNEFYWFIDLYFTFRSQKRDEGCCAYANHLICNRNYFTHYWSVIKLREYERFTLSARCRYPSAMRGDMQWLRNVYKSMSS
jgi:hypothetical protein